MLQNLGECELMCVNQIKLNHNVTIIQVMCMNPIKHGLWGLSVFIPMFSSSMKLSA